MQNIFFYYSLHRTNCRQEINRYKHSWQITIPYKPRGNGMENLKEQRKERIISDTKFTIPLLALTTEVVDGDPPLTSFLCRLDPALSNQ